jgi:Flp pilus assembly protein TadG
MPANKEQIAGDSAKKTAPVSSRRGFISILRGSRRMVRNEDGVTAVEFGIIAFPFLLLVVALLETALVFLTTLDLENAVKDASRLIRTGQAQNASFDVAAFRHELCNNISLISNCESNGDLVIDVRSFNDFQSINLPPIYDSDSDSFGETEYSQGNGLKVVVVRAYYKMKLLTQFPGVGLANIGNSHRLLDAIAVFRNEPF